ncbi:MAG TPA: cyclase family protein [Terriglobales bacterium]|nr:cyclase family protein [Terriglobales bacterium]
MSCRFLKVQLFVVAATLSIAMLLFAAQRRSSASAPQFRTIVDLTSSVSPQNASPTTSLVAPSDFGGAWTIDQLPAVRLIAPLVVIVPHLKNFPNSESLVTMDDVAAYERTHGPVPQGSIVLLASAKKGVEPVVDPDALRFLVEARNVVGFGTAGSSAVIGTEAPYLAQKGIYELRNVANLTLIPKSGAIGVAAPLKMQRASEAPVRLMAMLR